MEVFLLCTLKLKLDWAQLILIVQVADGLILTSIAPECVLRARRQVVQQRNRASQ